MRSVSAREAARELLHAAGIVTTDARPQLAAVRDGSDEELILVTLRERGLDARVVRLADGDLRWLRLPAAVQLDDGTWLVLRRRTRKIAARIAIEVTPVLDLQHPFRFAAAHARELCTIGAAALLVQLFAAAIPLLTRVTIDKALPHAASSMLTVIAIALALTSVFAALTTWVRAIAIVQLKAVFDVASGRALLQHFFRLPFASVQRRGVGESMQAMTGMQLARDLVLERVVRALLDLLGIAIYGAMLVLLFPAAAIVIAIAASIVIVAALISGSRQAVLQRDELTQQARQRSLLYEALAGIGTIKASGAEERTARQWAAIFTGEALTALRRMRAALGLEIVNDLARNGTLAVLLVWGGLAAMRGTLTLGSVVALVQLGTAVLAAASGAAGALVAILVTKQQLARTLELVRTPAAPARSRRTRSAARVVLDDVWFRHDTSAPWIIEACSFVVEPGAVQQLDGPSGSGKTTLLRLIAGLYTPERGVVRAGGAFAYLPQFPHLFGGTIADNLRIFSADAPMRAVYDVARATGLDAWVRALPMQYETRVAPGGLNISGGQRQLITLTAVLASDRPLLLLDEPMANLDSESRARIWRLPALAERTVIHASHDSNARLANAT